ncbi:hypothetical protein ACFE04_019319 [Oxalis oulophora]
MRKLPSSLLLAIVLSLFILARSDGDGGVCGAITKSQGCPINCFRPDPVCGVDGVTYWCGCPDAACSGVKVVKTGSCQVGNSGSASLPGQALLLSKFGHSASVLESSDL